MGIAKVFVDGVLIDTFDAYAAVEVHVIRETPSFDLAGGRHTLRVEIDGKNGSSSSYFIVGAGWGFCFKKEE